jgi:hypothetical protein
VQSLDDLQQEIGEVMPILAYPGGEFSEDVVTELREASFKLAFTTRRGINKLSDVNPLLISRVNAAYTKPLNMLRIQLATVLPMNYA